MHFQKVANRFGLVGGEVVQEDATTAALGSGGGPKRASEPSGGNGDRAADWSFAVCAGPDSRREFHRGSCA